MARLQLPVQVLLQTAITSPECYLAPFQSLGLAEII